MKLKVFWNCWNRNLASFLHLRGLLVSLWEVPDLATSFLMQRFYENRLGRYSDERNGRMGTAMSKAEALREAKRWLREYRPDGGGQPYEHPYFYRGLF